MTGAAERADAGLAGRRHGGARLDAPDWGVDGTDWPNRTASRFVEAGGLRWHVQVAGAGPCLLLLHGTGAATHSWAGLLPLLARQFRVVAPDLPGHGFTAMAGGDGMSLPGMAAGVRALLAALGAEPRVVVGHSAGAAIALRMALDGMGAPDLIVSLGGAILPLSTVPLHWFSPLARLMSATALLPRLFAFHAADPKVADRLLRSTGSAPPAATARFYARLFRRSGHAAGALAMMANWDLRPLPAELPRLRTRLLLIHGENDRTIPARDSARVAALVAGAACVVLPGLGHIAHEEDPAAVAALIAGHAARGA